MKRYLLLTSAMMGAFLLLFALAEALKVPLLTNPSASLAGLEPSLPRREWACLSRTWCCRCRQAS